MPPLTRAHAAAEAPTLLDALARAPAAAALVVAALDQLEDRRALRLAHPHLRDAVDEATLRLEVDRSVACSPSMPTPRRFPLLEALAICGPDTAALEALALETWGRLGALYLEPLFTEPLTPRALDAPSARALAAALRRMPALRGLELEDLELPDASAAAVFHAASAAAVPRLNSLTLRSAGLVPAEARALAATGWRLDALNLHGNARFGAAGVTALLAAPTFAVCRLNLRDCGLDAAALLALANAPWPLQELHLRSNDFSAPDVAPALAALSRRAGLRLLDLRDCSLSAANFKALVEAAWPALTSFGAAGAKVAFDGRHALGAAAFAGLPALERLDLAGVKLDEAGARLLASRRWPRLKELNLCLCALGDAGLAALVRGEWPALEVLDLRMNGLTVPLALEDARLWAPALVELRWR